MLVEVRVQSLGLDRSSNTPVVILQELSGDRVLPIWIGPGEASAIAMQLADMKFERPLTHDLLVSVLEGMGGTLDRVVISRVEKGTYYAELRVQRNGSLVTLDARPSDSIAVALRVDARMYADESLLERTEVEIAEDSEEAAPPMPASDSDTGQPMGPEELKEHLRRLNPEDFGRFNP